MPVSILRGRPWPAPGEPLFTDEDRDLALALYANEADACPGCGEPMSITTSPEAEGAYRADAIRCHGCAAQSRAARDVTDTAGLLVQFSKRPPEE